jgi:hypothetical protein
MHSSREESGAPAFALVLDRRRAHQLLFDTAQEIAQLDRLGKHQVATPVGGAVRTHLAVGHQRGEHDDGYVAQVGVLVQSFAHVAAIQSGHDVVQKNEIGQELPGGAERQRRAVFNADLVVPGGFEVEFDHFGQWPVIINYEDAILDVHMSKGL